MIMPPIDPPPATPDGTGHRPPSARRTLPPTSEERQIIAGCIAVIGGALILVATAYLAFNWAFGSTWKTYLVGGGAMGIIIVLSIVLMLYAPSPVKAQRATRIEDRSPAWAIGYAALILLWTVGAGYELYDMTQSGWEIGQVLVVILLVGASTGTAAILVRWIKARLPGRDQGRAEP
jgi:hypothetical protein